VASSLDGYIAGPNGEADWIIMDPDIDFGALFAQFDTLLMGRRTYEALVQQGNADTFGMKSFVFSRTLKQSDHPGITIMPEIAKETIAAMKSQPGKDLWLFGGGSLFRAFLDAGLVDTVELAVTPVLLGGGLPFLPSPAQQTKLKLTGHKVYKTGIVMLEYAVKSA
jgi:dihydrofolate reductase